MKRTVATTYRRQFDITVPPLRRSASPKLTTAMKSCCNPHYAGDELMLAGHRGDGLFLA